MTTKTFQEIANKTLADYTKNKPKKYGWTSWWPPEHTDQSKTVVFDYRATLWEESENYLVATMSMDKEFTEAQAVVHITEWLDENVAHL